MIQTIGYKLDNITIQAIKSDKLPQFFQYFKDLSNTETVQSLIREDVGTCIVGEGIEVAVLYPRCKIPRMVQVFTNRWSQGSQERALEAMVKAFNEEFPQNKGLFTINSGRMD